MKTFNKQCAQGDILITRLDGRPSEIGKRQEDEGGQVIVTHSETGHHHVMNPEHVHAYYSTVGMLVIYLHVLQVTQLIHLREHDTHEAVEFQPGWYQVNRQREYDAQREYRAAID